MAENSKIEWTDHTFNPWAGCQKVSPACDNCYAEAWAKRSGLVEWGPGAARRRTSEGYWKQPLKWNRAVQIKHDAWVAFRDSNPGLTDTEMEARGFTKPARPKVFCASLADVFDNQVPGEWREDLWALIHDTPHLDWLLLTKRPQNIAKMLPGTAPLNESGDHARTVWGGGWPNVWLGTTVENQEEADRRIPHLLAVPAAKRFLSCEPLLGPVDLRGIRRYNPRGEPWIDCLRGLVTRGAYLARTPNECCLNISIKMIPPELPSIDWVIAGGESGPGARPMHPDWARSLRDQCKAADVPFFWKQWGEWAPHNPRAGGNLGGDVRAGRVRIVHPTGQSDVEVSIETGGRNTIPGSRYMERVGKKKAGAMLDGREYREFPA